MSKTKVPDDTQYCGEDQEFAASEDAENTENAGYGSEGAGDERACAQGEERTGVTKEEEELNTRYLRLAADFQNYKRRAEKEKGDIYAYANEKIVLELLDVADNFERALQHSDSNESFAEGMNMIFRQLKGVLEKSGVEEMSAEGEPFDPNFHHAVLTENSAEHESGKVIQVLQKGYLLNKKVIRPAMVKVAE
ncbi:MAG TPA: nucleotide exchange factor GrpE [Anaerovoracaceae bacterium]|nr:nucleotide exchange factor GrpE [Anaerovoracaceae bacterium]